jgi:hypothetical protein
MCALQVELLIMLEESLPKKYTDNSFLWFHGPSTIYTRTRDLTTDSFQWYDMPYMRMSLSFEENCHWFVAYGKEQMI